MHLVDRAEGENDLAFDILALVVPRVGPAGDVHELGSDVGVLAVVGQRDGRGRKLGDHPGARRDFFERGRDGVPAVVAEEVGVAGLAVGGQALDRGVREPGCEQLLLHVLGRRRKSGRAVHPVEPAELAHRLERLDPVHLRVNGRRHRVRPEWDLPVLARGL